MDLATITMDRAEAREKFLEYRRAVRERHDAEDEAIMRGYGALSQGKLLLHLGDTIRRGGTVTKRDTVWSPQHQGHVRTDVRLPALAVMRASATECHVQTWENGEVLFTPSPWYRGRRDRTRVTRVAGVEHRLTGWSAMVPPVPPALRPKGKLDRYHILWEAEWSKLYRRPPGDPALLRRLAGDLFVVLATWDLTALERAVLTGRE